MNNKLLYIILIIITIFSCNTNKKQEEKLLMYNQLMALHVTDFQFLHLYKETATYETCVNIDDFSKWIFFSPLTKNLYSRFKSPDDVKNGFSSLVERGAGYLPLMSPIGVEVDYKGEMKTILLSIGLTFNKDQTIKINVQIKDISE